jgi:hypothetical protein
MFPLVTVGFPPWRVVKHPWGSPPSSSSGSTQGSVKPRTLLKLSYLPLRE